MGMDVSVCSECRWPVWLLCGWRVVGAWLDRDWCVVGVVGVWWERGWSVVGARLKSGWCVAG